MLSEFKKFNAGFMMRFYTSLRDRLQILLLVLSDFKRIN